jgi:hypothetical protein
VGAAFQQLEVDYFIGDPHFLWHKTDLHEAPIIRMYGVNQTGAPLINSLSPGISEGYLSHWARETDIERKTGTERGRERET